MGSSGIDIIPPLLCDTEIGEILQPSLYIEIEYFSKAVVRFSNKILAMTFSLVAQVFVLYSIMKWPTLVGTCPMTTFTSGVAFSLPHLLNTTIMVTRVVV